MRFLNSMPARIRALVALVVVLAGVSLVARFDDGQERRFESYDAMRAEGQGSYTWFPVFLPASARQIVLYTRVDTNYFHAGFSLDAKAMADFDVHLKTGASAEGLRLLREQQRGIGRLVRAGAVPGRRVGHALPDRQGRRRRWPVFHGRSGERPGRRGRPCDEAGGRPVL